MPEINGMLCFICGNSIDVYVNGKGTGLNLKCSRSALHFRGFIMDKPFMKRVLDAADPDRDETDGR